MKRITYPAACVLQSLANGHSYGFSVMDSTGLPSGTVYQILRRFEGNGLVRSRWEEGEEIASGGRPRRRYYRLTPVGVEALARAADRYRQHIAVFGGHVPQ